MTSQDMHRQIRMRFRELRFQFAVEGRVNGCPEGAAAGVDGGNILGGGLARRGCGELGSEGGVGRGEMRPEGVEGVNCAGDAVEGDAFEADFADEFGGFEEGCVLGG